MFAFTANSQNDLVVADTIVQNDNHLCIREYYKEDRKRIKRIYSIDANHEYQGTELKFEYYGNIQYVRTFKDNKLEGVYNTYYLGKLVSSKHYSENMLNGYSLQYDYSGKKITEGYYHNNNKIGKWVEYYATGKVKSEGHYMDSALFLMGHQVESNLKPALVNNKGDTLKIFDHIETPIDSLIQFFNLTSGFRHESQRNTLPLDIYFKTGKWYYYDEEGKLEKVELYDRGKFIKIITEKEK